MAIKINILPNYFLKKDGTFDKTGAINLCGKIAGVCYAKEGFDHLCDEPIEKTERRINMTLNNGHHSVYDHIFISFNIKDIPKILAMVINNEKEYTTSEKSARYTPVVRSGCITLKEEELYNKWVLIFTDKIKELYGDFYNDSKIKKLAQENARYLVTVFMPTEMIYTTSLRQINYIASWMKDYMRECKKDDFSIKLSNAMEEFIKELERNNVLVDGLMTNDKKRSISLFGKDLDKKEKHFGDIYETIYTSTFAYLAQAQRHRTLNYKIELLDNKEYFVPPIIESDSSLVKEWISDIKSVSNIYPQGEMIRILESGTYENFILKCKERLCTAAQLEIMNKTNEILKEYKKSLEESGNPLSKDIINYTKGARCTFKDFVCKEKCGFKEGICLSRKI